MENNHNNTLKKYDNLCRLELERFKACTSNNSKDSFCDLYETLYFNCQTFKKNKEDEFRRRRELDTMRYDEKIGQ